MLRAIPGTRRRRRSTDPATQTRTINRTICDLRFYSCHSCPKVANHLSGIFPLDLRPSTPVPYLIPAEIMPTTDEHSGQSSLRCLPVSTPTGLIVSLSFHLPPTPPYPPPLPSSSGLSLLAPPRLALPCLARMAAPFARPRPPSITKSFGQTVVVRLFVVKPDKIHLPERRILLTKSNPTASLGRSSSRPALHLLPAIDNGVYDSPVMSRHHAELSADFDNEASAPPKMLNGFNVLTCCLLDCQYQRRRVYARNILEQAKDL